MHQSFIIAMGFDIDYFPSNIGKFFVTNILVYEIYASVLMWTVCER